MIRRLLWLTVLALLVWSVRSLVFPRRGTAPRTSSARGRPTRETMVRDRVCNTFLPRSRALIVRRDDEELFFCSEACRASFLEGRRRVS